MAGKVDARFRCSCGTIAGEILLTSPKSGTHIECFCADCRAAHIYLGQADPYPDGLHIFQITPDVIRIDQGQDQLRALRLGPRGLLRWHARCCSVPMFNTLAKPTLPFAGIYVERFLQPEFVGKVMAQSFVPAAEGTKNHKGALVMSLRLLSRMATARFSGKWRDTPFFDQKSGKPTGPVFVLSKEDRKKLPS